MSEFNSCSSLLNKEYVEKAKIAYERELVVGRDPLQMMLNMQKSLQDKLADSLGRIPRIENIKTKGQLLDWMEDQKRAFDDEFREMVEAIAGMEKSEKERSAIWKKWKSNYEQIRAETVDSLSDFERKELLFELADMQIFYMNMMLALNVSYEDMYVLLYHKIAENFTRQERGY